jgi:hypothetical protein
MYESHQNCQERKRNRSWSVKAGGQNKKSTNSPTSHSSSSSVDDELGHLNAEQGTLITNRCNFIDVTLNFHHSCVFSDEVKRELGKGTFGKVFACKDVKHNDTVAIKVVRSIKRYVESARIESDILHDIYTKQKEKNVDVCVKMFSRFHFDGKYHSNQNHPRVLYIYLAGAVL